MLVVPDFSLDGFEVKPDPEDQQQHQQHQQHQHQQPPPIYITSPDPHGAVPQTQPNMYLGANHHSPSPSPHNSPQQQQSLPSRPPVPLTVQTQNLQQRLASPVVIDQPISPTQLATHQVAINTPLPPSPSPSAFLSDDEAASLYSPHSPHTPQMMPNGSTGSGNFHLAADHFAFQ